MANQSKNQSTKTYYLPDRKGGRVEVSEEIYRAYWNPVWAEKKRQQRENRCWVSNGRGKLVRCNRPMNECAACAHLNEQCPVSIDAMLENGYEPIDTVPNTADIVTDQLFLSELLQELSDILDELGPESRTLWDLLYEGKSQREMAAILGTPQSTLNPKIRKLRSILQDRLAGYFNR